MTTRNYQWWRLKRGFQGDREFIRLATLCHDDRTYWAAIGYLVARYDEAHTNDQREPAMASVSPAEASIVSTLVAAGLLDDDGSVPERTWNKWRLPNRGQAGGVARSAHAVRDEGGHFTSKRDQNTSKSPASPASTETERSTGVRTPNGERSTEIAGGPEQDSTPAEQKRGGKPTRIGEELNKPWNQRNRQAGG